ncbi:histidine utilization repressor [Rhodovibrionaceae bacterium A322]
MTAPAPLYEQIKQHILLKISDGDWKAGDKVPSENQLVRDMGVSRMTVHRALRELTQEGQLVRVQGTGTFVAERRAPVELMELRNIADEIMEKGTEHSAQLELLQAEEANDQVALALELDPGSPVYHSIMVHLADGKPLQVEDRYVNPAMAPDYLSVDFSQQTPNQHLSAVAPATEVEHIVEAVMPEPWVRELLKMPETEPALQMRRRTWSGSRVVASARLIHPGSSHSFGTRFTYRPDGTPRARY